MECQKFIFLTDCPETKMLILIFYFFIIAKYLLSERNKCPEILANIPLS